MAYSELVVSASYTVATDGSEYIVTDTTEYAPSGQGTATFPSENQVQKWGIWQLPPFDGSAQFFPETQDGFPFTVSNLGPGGSAREDSVNQFLLLIVPSSAVYATVLQDAQDSGDPWSYFVEYAETNGAIGQIAIMITPNGGNCTYDALRRFNNAQMGGARNCNPEEYATKKALLQGAYSNGLLAQSLPILSQSCITRYVNTQAVLDELTEYCNTDSNLCNCDC